MSLPKRRRLCLPVESFDEKAQQEQEELPNLLASEEILLQGVEFNTENVLISEDARLFFDILSLALRRDDFECLDNAMYILEGSSRSSNDKTSEDQIVEKEFIIQELHFLILNLFKIHKKIDEHHILRVLIVANSILSERSTFHLDQNDVDVLKIAIFSRIFEKRLEVFPCGCFQQEIIDLYMRNDRSRISKLLDEIVRKCLKKEQMLSKLNYRLNIENDPVKYFKLYSEIICEMVTYGYIDRSSDELWRIRIPHLMALLVEFPDSQFCTVCEKLCLLFESISNSISNNKSNNNMVRICKRLFARVFEFLEKNGRIDISICEERSSTKLGAAIRNGDFSHLNNSDVVHPGKLLESVLNVTHLWDSFQPLLLQNLAKTKVESPHFLPLCIYLLRFSFIRKSESEDIVKNLTTLLIDSYSNASISQKEMILFLVDLIESVGLQSSSMARIKQKILLTSETSASIAIRSLSQFSASEINEFLEKFASSLTSTNWNKVFEMLENSNEQLNSEILWKTAIQSSSQRARFIINQIEIMTARKDKKSLKTRIDQIISMFRESLKLDEVQPIRFLLSFCESILSSPADEFDPMLSNDIIPILLVSYCCFNEANEKRVQKLFLKLVRRIEDQLESVKMNIGERIGQNEEDVLKLIDRICEFSAITFPRSSCCDLKRWAASRSPTAPNGETYGDYLVNILKKPELSKKLYQNLSFYNICKERVIRVFARIFSKLSAQLRKMNESARSAYCSFSLRVQTEISTHLPSAVGSELTKWETVSVELIEGFGKCEKDWNLHFVRARVEKVLLAAKGNEKLYDKLKGIILKNEVLRSSFPQI